MTIAPRHDGDGRRKEPLRVMKERLQAVLATLDPPRLVDEIRANRARRLFDSYRRRSIERASSLCENHVLERCLGSADAYRQSRSALVSHVTLE
jgi:hypothetical protein